MLDEVKKYFCSHVNITVHFLNEMLVNNPA